MPHSVFISHSTRDKFVADKTCEWLERHGLRCWIAPRDILPGTSWGAAIISAIREARVMVLILSDNANASVQIRREVERAVHFGTIVIPMRIEDVMPQDELEYFLATSQWFDAFPSLIDNHLEALTEAIKKNIAIPAPMSRGELKLPSTEPATARPPEAGGQPGVRPAKAGVNLPMPGGNALFKKKRG